MNKKSLNGILIAVSKLEAAIEILQANVRMLDLRISQISKPLTYCTYQSDDRNEKNHLDDSKIAELQARVNALTQIVTKIEPNQE